jgi:polysaccharide pyruvyl transferase WcaK-like protein
MTEGIQTSESRPAVAILAHQAGQEGSEPRPRIALLTPYTGGNLGDAAIQDAIIANLQLRLPGAQFSGISLNCDNFVEQHAMDAFPLCATSIPFYTMCAGKVAGQSGYEENSLGKSVQKRSTAVAIKWALKRVPLLGWCLQAVYACWREFRHLLHGYHFLRTQDLLIVSGGGQMNEEWGGPWGQPFALFKWAVLAHAAKIPYVMASVGAGKATSRTARLFLSTALRMAQYRSYRDKHSRAFAAGLLRRAAQDSVVPDLAFSLLSSHVPPPSGIRTRAKGRSIVAISPIAYANPRFWPTADRAIYDRYVAQMTSLVAQVLERGHFLVLVCSSLGDDQSVVPELLDRLDPQSKQRLVRQLLIPPIATWKDFVATIQDVDFLIASRLHSAILGFVSQKPVIAISFDPKVDWLMEDLNQTEYLLHVRDFAAEDVINAIDRAKLRGDLNGDTTRAYWGRLHSTSELQYDGLAKLALRGRRHRY